MFTWNLVFVDEFLQHLEVVSNDDWIESLSTTALERGRPFDLDIGMPCNKPFWPSVSDRLATDVACIVSKCCLCEWDTTSPQYLDPFNNNILLRRCEVLFMSMSFLTCFSPVIAILKRRAWDVEGSGGLASRELCPAICVHARCSNGLQSELDSLILC